VVSSCSKPRTQTFHTSHAVERRVFERTRAHPTTTTVFEDTLYDWMNRVFSNGGSISPCRQSNPAETPTARTAVKRPLLWFGVVGSSSYIPRTSKYSSSTGSWTKYHCANMPKRSWAEANSTSPNSITSGTPMLPPSPSHARSFTQDGPSRSPNHGVTAGSSPEKHQRSEPKTAMAHKAGTTNGSAVENEQRIPSISRKVKACAACRKQKVCVIDHPVIHD
jgi:hypothetical protein